MFGREPRLPIDLAFGIETSKESKNMTKYVEELRDRLKKSYQLATEAAAKSQQRQKRTYDTKVKGAILHKGDRVLVRILSFDGTHKLSDKWEEDPYVIVDQPNSDIPVFVVKKENGEGRRRTLHRNHLLPIGIITEEEQEFRPVPKPRPVPRTRQSLKNKKKTENKDEEKSSTSVSTDAETDSEDESMIFVMREPTEPSEVDDSVPLDTDVESADDDDDVAVPDVLGDDHDNIEEQQDAGTEEDALQSEDVDEPDLGTAEAAGDDGDTDDDVDDQDELNSQPVELPVAAPRRSTRERTSTTRTKYKDYHVPSISKQAQPQADWMQRDDYLRLAAASGAFGSLEDEVPKALLKLITNSDVQ